MDRGSRYCSIDYQAELRRHGTKASTIVKPPTAFNMTPRQPSRLASQPVVVSQWRWRPD
jgi:hypothetical protein